MQFKNVIGQGEIKTRLISSIKEGRVSHAHLFLGNDGSGNLALALAYSQYLLCKNPSETDSCGKCPSCLKVEKLQHPDLHFSYPFFSKQSGGSVSDEFLVEWRESVLKSTYFDLNYWRNALTAENKQLLITTKEATNILHKLKLKSFEGNYKFVIIWRPEVMRTEAANKLLKIIEEPPEKTIFILVAESQENIIQTILSRTQITKIPTIDDQDFIDALLAKYPDVKNDEAESLMHYHNKNFFNACQFLEGGNEMNLYHSLFSDWMRKCYMSDTAGLMKFSDEMHKSGREKIKQFLDYSLNMVRQCLVGNYTNGELMRLSQAEMAFANKFAQFINDRNIEGIFKEINQAHADISRNIYGKLVLFDLSIKMMKLIKA